MREEEQMVYIPPYIKEVLDNRFSVHKPPPDVEYKLTKKNPDGKEIGVASAGELVMVYGAPKSRKSTLMSCMTASAYTNVEDSTLLFKMKLNEGDEILHFDTEMGRPVFHRRMMKLNRMCGYKGEVDIPGFYSSPMKGLTWHEKVDAIDHCVHEHRDAALIVIDQIADLVGNINDRDHTNDLISKIELWTSITGAILLSGIHITRGTEDMTGVLGSELAKKMDTGFLVEKQRLTRHSKVIHLLSREQDVDDFVFSHNEYGYPYLVKEEDSFF